MALWALLLPVAATAVAAGYRADLGVYNASDCEACRPRELFLQSKRGAGHCVDQCQWQCASPCPTPCPAACACRRARCTVACRPCAAAAFLQQRAQHKLASSQASGARTLMQLLVWDPVTDQVEKIRQDVEDMKNIPKRAASIPYVVRPDEDYWRYRRIWLPGWHMQEEIMMFAAIGFGAAVVWLQIYFLLIYKDDRSESLTRWNISDAAGPPTDTPDLVVVFHHPEYSYGDDEDEVEMEFLDHLYSHKKLIKTAFPRLHSLVAKGGMTTRKTIRTALLQDTVEYLPTRGFDVQAFASCDSDEMFVRITIGNEDVVQHYFRAHSQQVQLSKGLIKKLGIAQDPTESSSAPPWIVFDPALGQTLSEEGVKDLNPTELGDVYRTYHGTRPEGSVARSIDRIAIVEHELGKIFNVEGAVDEGLVVDWYPVHNRRRMTELKHMWGRWGLVWDFSFAQPIHHLRHYFGSRVAFVFAWTGFYAKALTALLVPALVCLGFMVGTWALDYHKNLTLEILQLGFAAVIIVWARMAYLRWGQECRYFCTAWNLTDSVPPTRPGYRGELVVSELNANDTELRGNPYKAMGYRYISAAITLFFCALVMVSIYVWITLFDGKIGIAASICLSASIKIFEVIFRPVAVWTTNLENHRYESDYTDALIWKNVAFESINYYYPFIYIMVFAKFTDAGCPSVGQYGQDCIWALRRSLMITVFILVGCFRVFEVFKLWAVARLKLKLEDWNAETEDGGPPPRAFMEEQAKYSKFEIQDQVETMLQLVLSLGYVVLFGAVAPVVVVIIWAVFVLQLRGSAWLLSHSCRRTFPEDKMGEGAWRRAVELILVLGVVSSALVLVIHGEAFKGTYLLTKITFTFIFVVAAFISWQVLAQEFPEKDQQTQLMLRKRDYVMRTVSKLGYTVSPPMGTQREAENLQRIAGAQFAEVPRLNPAHPGWTAVDTAENQEENEHINVPEDEEGGELHQRIIP